MADSALSRSSIRRVSPLRQGETSSRGSAIPTAGQRMAAEDAMASTQRGILELRRRQMMAQPAAGAAGTPASTNPPATETPAAKPTSTVPPLLARPRQGTIDGKPAAQVLSGMRDDAARGTTPAQTYGADVAKRNIEERGPQAAIEDYFNRNRLDAQRAPMPTEPGSMAERRAADEKNQMRPVTLGPAQRAMNESLRNPNVPYKPGGSVTPTYDALVTARSTMGPPVSAMPAAVVSPPLLSRPRTQAPAAEAPAPEAKPPALVQSTNAFADRLRARADTPYQQRMAEGAVTIDDMTKAVGSLPGKARRGLQRVREFSDRTNQWAENFRNSR